MFGDDLFKILGALSLLILAAVIVLSLVLLLTKGSRRFVSFAGGTVLGLLFILSICCLIIYARYKYGWL
jgi:hypothetical protein